MFVRSKSSNVRNSNLEQHTYISFLIEDKVFVKNKMNLLTFASSFNAL